MNTIKKDKIDFKNKIVNYSKDEQARILKQAIENALNHSYECGRFFEANNCQGDRNIARHVELNDTINFLINRISNDQ